MFKEKIMGGCLHTMYRRVDNLELLKKFFQILVKVIRRRIMEFHIMVRNK
jgi:Zn-dependent peptidase ImmA (M78 family)